MRMRRKRRRLMRENARQAEELRKNMEIEWAKKREEREEGDD